LSLPNPFPEARPRHPHRRRLPRHARHLARQMLKFRTAARGAVLQAHVRQLDSAVNLQDDRDRLHPDTDRTAPGVRVRIGPETRSLLRQLLESRDLRVQQQLVREIVRQVQKRLIAAMKRSVRWEKAKRAAARAALRARAASRRVWLWTRARARTRFGTRAPRVVGSRPPATRTRTTRAVGDGRAARIPATARAKRSASDRAGRAART